MPQLLVFAKDHSQDNPEISAKQLAGLYQVGDLICWRPFARITDISWLDGLVRIETESAHYIKAGMPIRVSGVVPDKFNGDFKAFEGTEGTIVIFELKDDPGKSETLGTVGWPWSERERKDPIFRILDWHGKDADSLDIMASSREPIIDENDKQITAFIIRERKFDLTQTGQNVKDYFSDSGRLNDTMDVTNIHMDAVVVVKADVPIEQASIGKIA